MRSVTSVALAGLCVLLMAPITRSGDAGADKGVPSINAAPHDAAYYRARGPRGLEEVLALEPAGNRGAATTTAASFPANVRGWRALVDAVAAQHDAWASRLYWYTDLDAAKAAAEESGKPILSLRLLGRLTDDQSCANSRFFRKSLYPNDDVRKYLSDKFILHWESVRPVPIVTIDFGDGRTLKRPITGNSVHYVLDCQGRLVDALPGLYSPRAFLAALRPAYEEALLCGPLEGKKRTNELIEFHAARINELIEQFKSDASRGLISPERIEAMAQYPMPDRSSPLWESLAVLYQEDIREDAAVLRVVAPGVRPVARANPLAKPKTSVEGPLVESVWLDRFSDERAEDTVYNEFALHGIIHQVMRHPTQVEMSLGDFTSLIYAHVFLAPLDDPWCGLKSHAFDGLDDEAAEPDSDGLASRR